VLYFSLVVPAVCYFFYTPVPHVRRSEFQSYENDEPALCYVLAKMNTKINRMIIYICIFIRQKQAVKNKQTRKKNKPKNKYTVKEINTVPLQ